MLDTCFPRPVGDLGHPQTFAVPVKPWVVQRAVPSAVVASASALNQSLLALDFSSAACHLAASGVWAITSSCGFLVLLQAQIQAAVPGVPVRTSSLLQLPNLLARHAQVGVLTIDAASLGTEHLLAAGVPKGRLNDVCVQGVDPDSEFVTRIMGNQSSMDFNQAQSDVVGAAIALKQRAPSLKHVVLECTNMPPYQTAVESATAFHCWSLRDDPVLQALAMKHCKLPLAAQLA